MKLFLISFISLLTSLSYFLYKDRGIDGIVWLIGVLGAVGLLVSLLIFLEVKND